MHRLRAPSAFSRLHAVNARTKSDSRSRRPQNCRLTERLRSCMLALFVACRPRMQTCQLSLPLPPSFVGGGVGPIPTSVQSDSPSRRCLGRTGENNLGDGMTRIAAAAAVIGCGARGESGKNEGWKGCQVILQIMLNLKTDDHWQEIEPSSFVKLDH